MKTRIISGLVGIALGLIALSAFNTPALNVLAVVIFGMSLYEIYHAFKERNTIWTTVLLMATGIVVLLYPKILQGDSLMLVLAIFTFCFAAIVVFNFGKIEFKMICANLAFGVYILVGLYSICRFKMILPFAEYGWDAAFLFSLVAVIAWGGDSFAYFTGVLIGKHKLAPTLSPKKTIEGAVGGIVGSVVMAWIFLWIYSQMKPILEGTNLVYNIDSRMILAVGILAFLGSIVGMIGDLFASAVKRQTGIKDYGNIMPGHGGIIDRFDSLLLVSPLISALAGIIITQGGIFYV